MSSSSVGDAGRRVAAPRPDPGHASTKPAPGSHSPSRAPTPRSVGHTLLLVVAVWFGFGLVAFLLLFGVSLRDRMREKRATRRRT
jgi:hypothetical protein